MPYFTDKEVELYQGAVSSDLMNEFSATSVKPGFMPHILLSHEID